MRRFRYGLENLLIAVKKRQLQFLGGLRFRIITTRFLIDRPSFDYQPLPWVGINDAEIRGDASHERWKLIQSHVPAGVSTLKDIGCCVGFFCHKFAQEHHIYTIGIDHNADFIDIANYVRARAGLEDKESFILMRISPETVKIAPRTDATLLFSIWHHWVADFGLSPATEMLQSVWDSTRKTLFFESGELEVAEEFGLPFASDARNWLLDYLSGLFPDAEIRVIGESESGNYSHYPGGRAAKRAMFAIHRTQ